MDPFGAKMLRAGAAGVAAAVLCAVAVAGEPLMADGPITIRLLESDCTSEVAAATLQEWHAKTPPRQADVSLFDEFVPACWAEDEEGDILLADRDGSVLAVYRWAFEGLDPRGRIHI